MLDCRDLNGMSSVVKEIGTEEGSTFNNISLEATLKIRPTSPSITNTPQVATAVDWDVYSYLYDCLSCSLHIRYYVRNENTKRD